MESQWNDKILRVEKTGFARVALEIFGLQYNNNPVYRAYCDALGVKEERVTEIGRIPFLPIRFFKSQEVKTGVFEPQVVFESSGTTGSVNSRHLIRDVSLYEASFINGFELVYGPLRDWCIIGLLPSYLERRQSSLVYMVNEMIRRSAHPHSGFYLDEFAALSAVLRQTEAQGQRTLLIGVTFALLDFAVAFPEHLRHTVIMETGGMKGRRREITRSEVHAILEKAFDTTAVHSEYGMTELLSQAYSKGHGLFQSPPWMKVGIRDETDPFDLEGFDGIQTGTATGALNVIDLANVHSCSFIATDDAGRIHRDGKFEVLGRMDNSDVRGCSLLSI
jgi:Acyl-protein synthetase, LuxE